MGSCRAWQSTALQHRTVGGYIKLCLWLFQEKDARSGGGGGRLLPITAHTGRLRPKGIPSQASGIAKSRDFTS